MSSSLLPRWAVWTAAGLAALPALLFALVFWLAGDPATPGPSSLRTAALLFGLLLAVLLGAALAFFFLAFTETARGGPPSVESSWGGLGGGLGGWRLSPALVYFLTALFLAGLFGYLADRVVGSKEFHAWSGVPAVESRQETEKPAKPSAKKPAAASAPTAGAGKNAGTGDGQAGEVARPEPPGGH